jgi:hypothetical protein
MAVGAGRKRGKSPPAASVTSARRRSLGSAVARAPTAALPGAPRCRRKFLRYYPHGFADGDYLDLERGYKWQAHERWLAVLSEPAYSTLLAAGKFAAVAAAAVAIEGRTNLLFSFEKMALRDAVKSPAGARAFAEGLFRFLHGDRTPEQRFGDWCEAVAGLPRRQTRVLTWPLVTVFGFIAQPRTHLFLKPTVTRLAAERYGFPFVYRAKPQWETYGSLLAFARTVRRDLADLGPRDMIDVQSFLWVQGSDEYPE